MILLDANVILDVWDRDPVWFTWSRDQMRMLSAIDELMINPVVYAEVSVSFTTSTALDDKLQDLGILFEGIPRNAAFWPVRPTSPIAS